MPWRRAPELSLPRWSATLHLDLDDMVGVERDYLTLLPSLA
ncbi:MAG TPA: hypothetical protein VHQ69_15405 [Methylomirabilota bacterium]|nr:hypothetical protein [Methylomirabilota bacterium]